MEKERLAKKITKAHQIVSRALAAAEDARKELEREGFHFCNECKNPYQSARVNHISFWALPCCDDCWKAKRLEMPLRA